MPDVSIDTVILQWLTRNSHRAAALHATIKEQIDAFKANRTPVLRMGATIETPLIQAALLIEKNGHYTKYGLEYPEAGELAALAKRTIEKWDENALSLWSKKFEKIRDTFNRMTNIFPENRIFFRAGQDHKIKALIFKYEVEKDKSGIPRLVISKETGDLGGLSLEIIELDNHSKEYSESIQPDLSRIFDTACHHVETIQLKSGKTYSAVYSLDGLDMFTRNITTRSSPQHRPVIGQPERLSV